MIKSADNDFAVRPKARGKIIKTTEKIDLIEYDNTAQEILKTANELLAMIAHYDDLFRRKHR